MSSRKRPRSGPTAGPPSASLQMAGLRGLDGVKPGLGGRMIREGAHNTLESDWAGGWRAGEGDDHTLPTRADVYDSMEDRITNSGGRDPGPKFHTLQAHICGLQGNRGRR